VDDILSIAEKEELEWLCEMFTEEFRWIISQDSDRCIEWQSDNQYKILSAEGTKGPRKSTSCGRISDERESFTVDERLPRLEEWQKKLFHFTVARLLYSSRWARPYVISVVGFLCTRMKSPTEEDWRKLLQV
jgi:hypothetical protein